MIPGVEYLCEGDIIPANASDALHLTVTVRYQGIDIPVIDAVVPNSTVLPDVQYTLAWSVTPGAVPIGNTVQITSAVSDEASGVLAMCATIMAKIIAPEETTTMSGSEPTISAAY